MLWVDTYRDLFLADNDGTVLSADSNAGETSSVDRLESILHLVESAIRREDGEVSVVGRARHAV